MVPAFDYENEEINAEFAPVERRTEFHVPADNYGYFLAKFGKLSRRAKKLNQAIEFTVLDTYEKKVGKDALDQPIFRTYYKIHCDAQPVKIEGYTFVAKIDHVNEAGNIVCSLPNTDFEVPAKFRTAKPFCQHCNSLRTRRNTFLLRQDATGDLRQIGKNCLADFIGRDPAAVIAQAEWLGEFAGGDSDDDFDGVYGMRNDRTIDTLTYLEHTAVMIRTHGWVSSAMALRAGEEGPEPTKRRAHLNMYPPKDPKTGKFARIEPRTDEDKALAKAALEWALSLEAKGSRMTEYEHNILVLAKSQYIEFKSEGFAASIVSSYLRAQEKLKIAQKKFADVTDSKHLGDVKQRISFGKCRVMSAYEGVSGLYVVYRYTFATADGNVLEWRASSAQGLVQNAEVTLKGTVLGHGEYKGIKRTRINRAVWEKVAS